MWTSLRDGFPDGVRAAAANALLNRGWGLPRQAVDGSLAIVSDEAINRMSLEEVEARLAELEERRQVREIEGTFLEDGE